MREVARSRGCKGKNRAKSSTGAGRQQVDARGGDGRVRGRVEVEAGEGRREAQRRGGGERATGTDWPWTQTERTTVPFLVFGSAFLYSKERWVTSSAVSSTLKAQTQGARHAREGMGKTWTL